MSIGTRYIKKIKRKTNNMIKIIGLTKKLIAEINLLIGTDDDKISLNIIIIFSIFITSIIILGLLDFIKYITSIFSFTIINIGKLELFLLIITGSVFIMYLHDILMRDDEAPIIKHQNKELKLIDNFYEKN